MRRMVMVTAMLVVATEATAWTYEKNNDQGLTAAGGERDSAMRRIASAEATPAVAPTARETDDSAQPTEPTAPVEPAGEENRTKNNAAAPQPQLDLDALEERIRLTDALGFFTKLSLKNQVDDLLSWFRAYHAGKSELTIEQLREHYDLLLLKLVSLLEDGDAQLSRDIFTSRRAIWDMLADPEQFAKLQES